MMAMIINQIYRWIVEVCIFLYDGDDDTISKITTNLVDRSMVDSRYEWEREREREKKKGKLL